MEEITNNKICLTINIDNQSAIIKNGVVSIKSQHIEVQFYCIKEKMDEGLINTKYCPTDIQNAEVFTKAVESNNFEKFRAELVM